MRRCVLLMICVLISLGAQPTTQPRDEAGGKRFIEKIIEAHGGAKAFAAITSMRTTLDAGPRHSVNTVVLPDRLHGEMETHSADPKAPPKRNATIIGPDGAWYFDGQWRELAPQNREATMRYALATFAFLLCDAESGKYRFAIVGSDSVEGKPASVLQIDGPQNLRVIWLVDPTTGEILSRYDGSSRSVYDQWQTIAGVRLPTHSRVFNSKTQETIESNIQYEINPKIDAKEFGKPPMPTTPPTTGPTSRP